MTAGFWPLFIVICIQIHCCYNVQKKVLKHIPKSSLSLKLKAFTLSSTHVTVTRMQAKEQKRVSQRFFVVAGYLEGRELIQLKQQLYKL